MNIFPLQINRDKIRFLVCLGIIFFLIFSWSISAGDYSISFIKVCKLVYVKLAGAESSAFSDDSIKRMDEIVLWNVRLPRIILAALTGVALSVAGAAYQGCFRNPLVEPYLLGVSAGAAFGTALAIVFPHVMPQGQVSAFCFAMAAVMISYSLARREGITPPVALILSGIIVGAFFSALVGIMKYLAADAELREITFWMMGGFYYATWEDVWISTVVVLPCAALIMLVGHRLNLLSLGDDEARSLGVHPDQVRLFVLAAATLGAAVCVSIVGIIAWIGLMMPHAARMLIGPDNRFVIPAASILGAMYMLLCDTIARTLTNAEIPVAIIVSILGAPYLLWLLRGSGKGYGLYDR